MCVKIINTNVFFSNATPLNLLDSQHLLIIACFRWKFHFIHRPGMIFHEVLGPLLLSFAVHITSLHFWHSISSSKGDIFICNLFILSSLRVFQVFFWYHFVMLPSFHGYVNITSDTVLYPFFVLVLNVILQLPHIWYMQWVKYVKCCGSGKWSLSVHTCARKLWVSYVDTCRFCTSRWWKLRLVYLRTCYSLQTLSWCL